jgi:hypothetical protein
MNPRARPRSRRAEEQAEEPPNQSYVNRQARAKALFFAEFYRRETLSVP